MTVILESLTNGPILKYFTKLIIKIRSIFEWNKDLSSDGETALLTDYNTAMNYTDHNII